MKQSRKNIFYITLSILGVFLIWHYKGNFERLLISLWHAANPILIGIIIAYLINILMTRYEKFYFPKKTETSLIKKTRRPVCLTAAILTLSGIVTLICVLVTPRLISCTKIFVHEIPPAVDELMKNEIISKTVPAALLSALSETNWQESVGKIAEFLFSGIGTAAETLFSAVSGLISLTITLFLSLVFAIYILLSKERLISQIKTVSKSYLPEKLNNRLSYIITVFNCSFRGFIVGQCAEAVILGILCIIGMFIFRFPYAVMIGTLIGFTALIPIAGAFIGAGIGAIMIFTVSPFKAVLFILFIIVLQQLEENLIYPKVVGNRIGLPSFFVLAAITIGGGLFGILGILLAVPVFSALYKLLRNDIVNREYNRRPNDGQN